MIILMLLVWMLIGCGTIYVAVLIHFVKAEMNGYDALSWWKRRHSTPIFGSTDDVLRFIVGLVIWPVRLYEFLVSIPKLYELYELKI